MSHPPLTAIGTGRAIDVSLLDRPTVFLCFAQATQNAADPIEAAIRERYPTSEVLVAYVVDLHRVPGMLRGVPERMMKSEFEKAVAALPEAETAEDYVVVLPDWDGAFVKSLDLQDDVSKQLGLAVFRQDGALVGTAQGPGATSICLDMLSEARH
jgi:hypothetical protein